MHSRSYVYPNFGGPHDFGLFRVGGAGLANCLLSWARASVFADLTGSTRISPTWPSLKLGPLFRRERDKRFYVGLFNDENDAVSSVRKLHLMAALPRQRIILPTDVERVEPGVIYVTDGSAISPQYFDGLLPYREMLKRRLFAMTSARWLAVAKANNTTSIAVHVRLGDFVSLKRGGISGSSAVNMRIPVGWYVNRIRSLWEQLGSTLSVGVFSDGSDEELAPLLALPGTKRCECGNAIADILALSQAPILIASGSTFSMWAAFLGEGVALYHPGRLFQRVKCFKQFEIETAEDCRLPTEFIDAAHKVLYR